MKLQDLTIKQFLEKTASNEAMPAGGSTIALCAALASALTEMVTKLTLGKKKYADAEDRIKEIASEMSITRIHLLNDIDRDADTYQVVLDAYNLPKDSDEQIAFRNSEIEIAMKSAALVQMEVAEVGHKLLSIIHEISNIVSGSVIADIIVSSMICRTAIMGALINVRTNLVDIKESKFKEELITRCDKIEKDIENKL